MKKLLSLSLALCILCTFAACALAAAKIDLDLAPLSGTAVYAQVYNILMDPEPFLGRTIRIAGYYDVYEDPETNTVYHACIIPDATACCAQGIEFVWAGEHTFPDDYKELGTDLTVTGRLETYVENGITYMHLTEAEVEWDEAGAPFSLD